MSSSIDATPVWPVESKVKAATGGAGLGVIVGQVIDWAVDQYVITPGHLDGNPIPVTLAIMVLASAAVAYVGGYLARHNARPADAINAPGPTVPGAPAAPVPAAASGPATAPVAVDPTIPAPPATPEPATPPPMALGAPDAFSPVVPAAPQA